MRQLLTILIGLWMSTVLAKAERAYGTINPSLIREDLFFDINTVPVRIGDRNDLNFAPNIVFTPDSTRAFVSFPASDTVMMFDPKSGEVLALIPVAQTPNLIVLTPDGKTLLVVCLLFRDNSRADTFRGDTKGAICRIDVETLEVETLELEATFFSFVNNLLLMPDGKSGFIASSGTDEVLRLGLEPFQELSPRIELPGGTRPSSITLAPDASFFAVITVGSVLLSPGEEPDAIRIIDTGSFSITSTLVPSTLDLPVPLPHDFVGANTLAITPDGRFACVADRETGQLSTLPELALDHALLIDLSQGTTLRIFGVSGIPSWTTLTPDGKWFAVISTLDVDMIPVPVPQPDGTIDVDSLEAVRLVPQFSEFRPGTRPTFSADGNFLFLGAPIDDFVMKMDLRTFEFPRPILVGQKLHGADEDFRPAFSAAPLEVATTPDGEVMTVLNFNSSTIDLIGPSYDSFLPRMISNATWFTGIAVANLSDGQAGLDTRHFNNGGIRLQDLTATEDVIEFGPSPKRFPLAPGEQFATTARLLTEAQPEDSTFEGWIHLDVDQKDVVSFFMTGDRLQNRLDGGLAVSQTAQQVVLPVIRIDGDFQTEIIALSPNISGTDVSLTLFNHAGEILEESTRLSFAGVVTNAALKGANGFFSDAAFEGFEGGYVVVESGEGIVAFERYFDGERLASLNGIPVRGTQVVTANRLYFPQAVAFGGTSTVVTLSYLGTETTTVKVIFKDDQGADVATAEPIVLEPNQGLRRDLTDLLPGLVDPGVAISGWLHIESSEVGLVGSAELQVFSGLAISAIPAESSPKKAYAMAHLANGGGFSTGMAVLYPGAEGIAEVEISIYTSQGDQVGQKQLSLGPGHREVKLLSELIPGLPALATGYAKIVSDQPIFALELIFADALNLMSAVPAQPLSSGL